ncbi:MAG TPA: protocatechuate dioxygenase [Aldersonia sp.]
MNDEVRRSRERVSRRRALSLGGTVGLAGLIAACTDRSDTSTAATTTAAGTVAATTDDPLLALLDSAPTCIPSKEETQGPYWFDVDSIRSDVREGRPGLELQLAMRVQDLDDCATPISSAVVEIWHCDAGGSYSGFESGSAAANGPGMSGQAGGQGAPGGAPGGQGGPPDRADASGETSDGSYSSGEAEATTSDDGTYLRGAQATDASGIVRFTTIYPGWYRGRTVHIHIKVHIDRQTVLTSQLFFDDDLSDAIFAEASPYTDHAGRGTRNDTDGIFDETGILTTARQDAVVLAAINLGITG